VVANVTFPEGKTLALRISVPGATPVPFSLLPIPVPQITDAMNVPCPLPSPVDVSFTL